jgi:hypothetical protein
MGPYSSRPNEKLGFYLPVMIKKFAAAKSRKATAEFVLMLFIKPEYKAKAKQNTGFLIIFSD